MKTATRSTAGALLLLGSALLLATSTAVSADEFSGEFEGRDGLHLQLEGDDGLYMGALQLGGEIYLCEARRGGAGLVGTLEGEDGPSPFTLRAAGGRLVLEHGGASHSLWPIGEMPEAATGAEPARPEDPTRGGEPPQRSPDAAGGAGSGAQETLAGRWQGAVAGTPATLTFNVQGQRLSGRLEASGYPYELQGTTSGTRAQGQVTDLQTGGTFAFDATATGDALDFVLVSRDPLSGMEQRQPLAFRRAGAVPDAGGGAGSAGTGRTAGVPPGPRDPALVGLWRQTESMSGGGAAVVVDTFLRIDADGTWAMGGGRAVGGGPGWGGDTGRDGVQETGYWKSENRIIYVQSPGAGQWQPFARYYVEPGRLMFTFADNTRQVLHRVQ